MKTSQFAVLLTALLVTLPGTSASQTQSDAQLADTKRKEETKKYLAIVDGSDESMHRHAVRWLAGLNLPAEESVPVFSKLLANKKPEIRDAAIKYLGEWGAGAKPLISHLFAIVRDPKVSARTASDALDAAILIDPKNQLLPMHCVALLKRIGKDGDRFSFDGFGALEALASAGPAAKDALPTLRPILDMSEETQHHRLGKLNAYVAIGKIANPPAPALAELRKLKAIVAKPPEQTYAVFQALRAGEKQSAFAIPLLTKTLAEPAAFYVRVECINTLIAIDPSHPEIARAVLDALNHSDWGVYEPASKAVASLDASSPRILEPVSEFARRHDTAAIQAVATLTRMKALAKPAIPDMVESLKELTRTNKPILQAELLERLTFVASMGKDASAATAVLVQMLPEQATVYRGLSKHDADFLRAHVMAALAAVGSSKDALPFILDGLENSSAEQRQLFVASARAAVPLGADAAKALPGLRRMLGKDGGHDHKGVAFGRLSFVPSDDGPTARLEAIWALGKLGASDKETLDLLQAIANQPDGKDREQKFRDREREEARKALEVLRKKP